MQINSKKILNQKYINHSEKVIMRATLKVR